MSSATFFRIFRHLLPDSIAWRIRRSSSSWKWGTGHKYGESGLKWGFIAAGRMIDRLFDGLTHAFADARTYIDEIYLDLFPDTTRRLAEWEQQFGLDGTGSKSDRIALLEAHWQAQGGQDPHYLQTSLRAAGFDVYVHEWWDDDYESPVVRNPLDYTIVPRIGTVQCTPSTLLDVQPQCSSFASQPQCNAFLANDPGYLVNDRMTPTPPPPIPADGESDAWRYFLYIGGETFPNQANVPADRRAALERLVLKLKPAQQWVVMLINYT